MRIQPFNYINAGQEGNAANAEIEERAPLIFEVIRGNHENAAVAEKSNFVWLSAL